MTEAGSGPAGAPAWDEQYRRLVEIASARPLDVDDVERLAMAAHFVGDDERSLRAWEDAHHLWVRLGNGDRAARCAFWLGLALLLRGEEAPANGWFARGRRVLAKAPEGCAGHGYLLVPAAMEALGSGNADRAASLYEEAGAVAERCDDADLLALSLLGRGEAALFSGDVKGGLALLDEAMVSATDGRVSFITTGILYCAVIDACVKAFDVRRATQWTNALARWCDGQPGIVPYRGQCLVHRAQVLQAQGAWGEALAEAARAEARLMDPAHPAAGVAFYQQGELHRLRGDFAAAERAYRRASEHGRDPTPGLALLRLAEGRREEALVAVTRMLDESADDLSRLAVLPAFVEIAVAAGDVAAARRASEELSAIGTRIASPLVEAVADHARAAALLADGEPSEALKSARRACRGWQVLDMPYEAARAQEVVAAACEALGDRDAAQFERDAARATFERLGAQPDLTRLAARGPAPAGTVPAPLTDRECEVLRLVAAGNTNRAIGAALHISEHTAARHVQNIFTKLGVASRAAATAYAYEHRLV